MEQTLFTYSAVIRKKMAKDERVREMITNVCRGWRGDISFQNKESEAKQNKTKQNKTERTRAGHRTPTHRLVVPQTTVEVVQIR
jgi:hypothetical protein